MQDRILSGEQLSRYADEGYLVLPRLFESGEAALLREHYMKLRAAGSHPCDMVADVALANDPLQQYPRMIHMHRWDEVSRNWLLDARLQRALTGLLGAEPLAVQSMVYFKPPGARGQAVHQDNFYLRARPGTCMAAWLALDDCDEENGCMMVVPGSHAWPLLCPVVADSTASFTSVSVPLPPGVAPVAVPMQAGDVLFFSGTLVHGSKPNLSKHRFRRALIGHYIEAGATQVTLFDQPVLRMDGTEVVISDSAGGAPCGVWEQREGQPAITVTGRMPEPGNHE